MTRPGLLTATFVLLATAAEAQTTALFLDSQPGDYVGAGSRQIYSTADAGFAAATTFTDAVEVFVNAPDFTSFFWDLRFLAADGAPLVAGSYRSARRALYTPFNGLDVSGSGRGCSELTGRFVVREIEYGVGGAVVRFAADFEQHCEDAAPALFGAIRYNSTISDLLPFGGQYPLYELSVPQPAHGRVLGGGLDCGGLAPSCTVTLDSAAILPLNAIPDAGYMFAGWTDDCRGGTSIALHVNGPKQCSALFAPLVAPSPRTLLLWYSHPGDYIGQGRDEVYAPSNSRWTVSSALSGREIDINIESLSATSSVEWSLRFRAPEGSVLQSGVRYTGATRAAFATVTPGIEIFGDYRGCNEVAGTFTVRELVFGAGLAVEKLAIDFEQHCEQVSNPPLAGSLRYNSVVGQPTIAADHTSLEFAAITNGTAFTLQSSPQIVRLTQLGPGTVTWTANSNQPWFTVSPTSGIGSRDLAIDAAFATILPASGAVTGTITVALDGAADSLITITMTLRLYAQSETDTPIGTIDTPLDNTSGASGEMPVTGWAVDDLGVAGVTICRAPVAGEVASSDARCSGLPQVFLGDAVFIEGARPDVELMFSEFPQARRAGWGLMVLTNMLPAGGNGTFILYAHARDLEGNARLLGARTITCDNRNATTPFGTIDTPAQGEIVSGSSYLNFGWALTQNPKVIAFDGSTIATFVDGVSIGPVSYNNFRPDVAALFPGLGNSNGAVGYRIIDTTTLTNGVHTIAWVAADSGGAASGFGSRYFTVSNGVTALTTSRRSPLPSATIDALPIDSSPIVARTGWDVQAGWHLHDTVVDSRHVIHGEEVSRIEIRLAEPDAQGVETGYLRVGSALMSLPVGAHLDSPRHIFTWAPGVGFSGPYDFVFVHAFDDRPSSRRELRIVLDPKRTAQWKAHVVMDTPPSSALVTQPFLVGGWSADPLAASGTGVSTLHIWAYPAGGGPPVFLGVANYGGHRPDVGAALGTRFADSGYGLLIHGLPPGQYLVAVFAWLDRLSTFAPAQTAHITVR